MVLWSARRPNAVEHWPDDRAYLIDQNRIGLHVKQLQIRLDLRLAANAHQSTGDIKDGRDKNEWLHRKYLLRARGIIEPLYARHREPSPGPDARPERHPE